MEEMAESRKALIDMFQKMDEKQELIDKKEKINKNIADLKKELGEIAERAYSDAISAKIGEYQEKAQAPGLSNEEREQIQQERKDFEENPEKYGVTRDKSPIVNEADKARALQIVELLKDTEKLGEEKDLSEAEFVKYMKGFGERQTPSPKAE